MGFDLCCHCLDGFSLCSSLLPSSFTGVSKSLTNKSPTWKSLRTCLQGNPMNETSSNLLDLEGIDFNDLTEISTSKSALRKKDIHFLGTDWWKTIELYPPQKHWKEWSPTDAVLPHLSKASSIYPGPHSRLYQAIVTLRPEPEFLGCLAVSILAYLLVKAVLHQVLR